MWYQNKRKIRGLGIMSGTSLDGIDVASVSFEGDAIQECDFESYPIDGALKAKILAACNPDSSGVDRICSLNFELGSYISECVQLFLDAHPEPIDFIATHGQTIYHIPNDTEDLKRSTLQIGEPAFLAYRFHVPVVSNFRVMDMVAGGEGAPLVPFTESILFYDPAYTSCIQNIGGIGNVSVISKDRSEDVMAFDTGPGNMWINAAMQHFYNQPYDKDGVISDSGAVISELMAALMTDPYFEVLPPKSTGREYFSEARVLEMCNRYEARKEDLIHTLTRFTAYSIFRSYQDYILDAYDVDRMILCGGGAYNPALVAMIREYFGAVKIPVFTMEDLGYSSDAKEAVAFALLGYHTLQGNTNNLPSATGAKKRVVLGMITPAQKGEVE